MLWCGCCRSFVLRHLAITSSVPFSLYFKSDQHQSSPNNVNTYLREKVMRINQLITKGKVLWPFDKISKLISWEMFGGEFGELACGYWDFLRVIWNLWKWWSLIIVKVNRRGFYKNGNLKNKSFRFLDSPLFSCGLITKSFFLNTTHQISLLTSKFVVSLQNYFRF